MLITYEEKSKGKEKEIESEEDCSVINRMDVKKLQDAERLPGIKILSEAQFDNICEAADKIVNFSYITGSDALLQRKPVFQIASGSHVPDELFAVTNHGIDAGDVKKLLDAGIFTNNGLMLPTKKNFSYITGSDALLQRKPIFQITSGSEAPDELFAVSNNGINADDVKRLLDAGIFTCNGLMMHTKKSLTGIKGLSEAKVDKICEAAENIVNFGYFTGSEALLKRMAAAQITTKSQALDELLAGGIDTKAINNAFRKFRCGNTQLAHRLCVTTQLPGRMKGGNGKVAYIDTEGTFRPDRIVPIAEKFGMDPGAVLDNIIYARAYTYEHQYNLLLGLAAKMSEEPFRLLIVDSITALFRVDFTGGGELADRQQKLAQMLSLLIKIAEEFNVTVYMTNQVIVDPKKPAGGRVIDGPFDNVTCAVFYDVDPYNFVDEEYMLDEDAAMEAHVVGDVGAKDEDELTVSSDGDVSLSSDDDFLNEHFLFYYKQPLEVKSRIDQMPGLQSFDDLFSRAVQLVTQIETPDQVDLNRERDGEEALASFAKYYLSTLMTPRDVYGDSAIQLFYNEGFSEAIYLKLEDTENMDFDSFKPSMIKARPPSELWYSEEWVD